MLSYVARRLLYAVLTFFGITIAVFALIHLVPGDPISFYIASSGTTHVSVAVQEAIRHEHHLDEPLVRQYLWWLRGVLTLDFGSSIVDHRPVMAIIFEKLPNTFELNLIAFLLSAAIGVPIGLWSATTNSHRAERFSAVTFFLLYSLPSFWVALMLMQFFSVKLRLLPLFGMSSEGGFGDHLSHLVLPVITLSYAQLAIFARFSKAALTEVIRQDFIVAARAKGVSRTAIVWRHGLRNALIPLITLLGLTIPFLISGSVIVEQIFQWDGIGRLYFESILSRVYPTVLGLAVTTAIVTLRASLAADLLYATADPRVRLEGPR